MLIAVDAVGGDHFPGNPVEGAILALDKDPEISVLLVGPEQMIKNELQSENYDQRRLKILHAPEIIGMDESPATAVRNKQMSSIVVGIGALKQRKCDAFVSAGNTGALLAASTFILGKLEGVLRPTIASYYPTIEGFKLLVDAGANLELKPEMLIQFADMASIFCREILEIPNPRVGLLNVGEEAEKGTEMLKAAYKLLKEKDNFVGNLEGKDILFARADVYLTDGVTGNVTLKFGESFPDALKTMIMNGVKSGAISRDDAQTAQHVLSTALDPFNYEHVGGIPFLGVDGVSIVGHGGSSATAICNMILGAKKCVTAGINQKIVDSLN